MTTKNSIILILLVTIFSLSCKKSEFKDDMVKDKLTVSDSTTISSSISYNGMWLKFSNIQHFNQVIQELKTSYEALGDSILDNFENNYSGFNSIRTSNNILQADDAIDFEQMLEDHEILYSPDDVFSTLVSNSGYLQIGDSIFGFKPTEFSYIASSSNEDAILDGVSIESIEGSNQVLTGFFYSKQPLLNVSGVLRTHLVPSTVVDIDAACNSLKPGDNNINNGLYVDYIYDDVFGNNLPTRYNGQPVRFEVRIYQENYIVYSCAGAKIQIQNQKNNGKWKTQIDAEKLSILGCAKGLQKSSVCDNSLVAWQKTINKSGNNIENLNGKLIDWLGPLGCFYACKIGRFDLTFGGKYRGVEILVNYVM